MDFWQTVASNQQKARVRAVCSLLVGSKCLGEPQKDRRKIGESGRFAGRLNHPLPKRQTTEPYDLGGVKSGLLFFLPRPKQIVGKAGLSLIKDLPVHSHKLGQVLQLDSVSPQTTFNKILSQRIKVLLGPLCWPSLHDVVELITFLGWLVYTSPVRGTSWLRLPFHSSEARSNQWVLLKTRNRSPYNDTVSLWPPLCKCVPCEPQPKLHLSWLFMAYNETVL